MGKISDLLVQILVFVAGLAVVIYLLDKVVPGLGASLKQSLTAVTAGTAQNATSGVASTAIDTASNALSGLGDGINQGVAAVAGVPADQANNVPPFAGFGPENEASEISNLYDEAVAWYRSYFPLNGAQPAAPGTSVSSYVPATGDSQLDQELQPW